MLHQKIGMRCCRKTALCSWPKLIILIGYCTKIQKYMSYKSFINYSFYLYLAIYFLNDCIFMSYFFKKNSLGLQCSLQSGIRKFSEHIGTIYSLYQVFKKTASQRGDQLVLMRRFFETPCRGEGDIFTDINRYRHDTTRAKVRYMR